MEETIYLVLPWVVIIALVLLVGSWLWGKR